MKAKQTVIELTNDVLGGQEVVEHPLFSERPHIRTEDRRSVRPEVTWLVDSDQYVF